MKRKKLLSLEYQMNKALRDLKYSINRLEWSKEPDNDNIFSFKAIALADFKKFKNRIAKIHKMLEK